MRFLAFLFLFSLSISPSYAANVSMKKGASDSMSLEVGGSEKVNIDTSGNMTVTGTVTGATPTASSHLATKAYVDSASASGGGGGGASCGFTRTAYNGNLGGYSGADAKCVSEFGTGWRFADRFALAGYLGGSLVNTGDYAWFYSDRSSDCADWSNGTNGDIGTRTTFSSSTYFNYLSATTQSCDNTYVLACCKY